MYFVLIAIIIIIIMVVNIIITLLLLLLEAHVIWHRAAVKHEGLRGPRADQIYHWQLLRITCYNIYICYDIYYICLLDAAPIKFTTGNYYTVK